MRCDKCGKENPAGMIFCVKCGAKLSGTEAQKPQPRLCTGCGAEVPESAKFCPECGRSCIETVNTKAAVSGPGSGNITVKKTFINADALTIVNTVAVLLMSFFFINLAAAGGEGIASLANDTNIAESEFFSDNFLKYMGCTLAIFIAYLAFSRANKEMPRLSAYMKTAAPDAIEMNYKYRLYELIASVIGGLCGIIYVRNSFYKEYGFHGKETVFAICGFVYIAIMAYFPFAKAKKRKELLFPSSRSE